MAPRFFNFSKKGFFYKEKTHAPVNCVFKYRTRC